MSDTTIDLDKKLDEITYIINSLKKELPKVQNAMLEMYHAIYTQNKMNEEITSQYQKLSEMYENFIDLQNKQLSLTKEKFEEIDDYLSSLKHKKKSKRLLIPLEPLIRYAPSIIAIISFISYIVYALIKFKLNGG